MVPLILVLLATAPLDAAIDRLSTLKGTWTCATTGPLEPFLQAGRVAAHSPQAARERRWIVFMATGPLLGREARYHL